MPGFNQRGPMGDGPMTGRRMGRCTSYGAQEVHNRENLSDNTPEQVYGRGLGRGPRAGMGMGGRGMGRGRG